MVGCAGFLIGVFGQMLRSVGIQLSAATTSFLEDSTPREFIYDSTYPPEMRMAGLAGFKTNVLIFACLALKLRPVKAEAWLQRAIAESLVSSLVSSLAVYSALTQIEVPVDLLPADARLDLAGMFERTARANLAFERLQAAAQSAEGDTYPAIPLLDD
jgi:hypothetical protein